MLYTSGGVGPPATKASPANTATQAPFGSAESIFYTPAVATSIVLPLHGISDGRNPLARSKIQPNKKVKLCRSS